MEAFNRNEVFKATNSEADPEQIRNKIKVLETKLANLEQNLEVPDLLAGEADFSDSLSSFEEPATLRMQISELYEILAEKEGIKKAA